jgi:hypothetical protein
VSVLWNRAHAAELVAFLAMGKHPRARSGEWPTPEQRRAAFDELEYVWRLLQSHDGAMVRVYLRRRLEQLVDEDPALAPRLAHVMALVRALNVETDDAGGASP